VLRPDRLCRDDRELESPNQMAFAASRGGAALPVDEQIGIELYPAAA
jgi:hypothetical protein